MTAAPAALAWEFWGRHRLGLAGVAVLVAAFALYGAFVPMTAIHASISSIWFVMGLFYVVGAFAYGFEGRLESAESGFPARLFLLPVRTWLLVAWPMIQGMTLAVLLWTLWSQLVLRPAGVETQAWWTAMLAAIVAVSQAMVWLPLGLPWLRLFLLTAMLIVLVNAPAVLALIDERLAEPTAMLAFSLALIPLSFLAAWSGVSRARHGDSPDWLRVFQPFRFAPSTVRERPPFRSALRAQTWLEWRRSGFGFVFAVVLMIGVLVLWGAFVERTEGNRIGLTMNFPLLPLIIGSFWGLRLGSTAEPGRGPGLTAFAAARPLSNTMLVAAKLRAGAWAAVIVWAWVLALAAVWLGCVGGFAAVERLGTSTVQQEGLAKAIAIGASLLVLVPLLYWRCLVANLWIALLGRMWVIPAASVLMSLPFTVGLSVWVDWTSNPAKVAAIREAAPGIAACALAIKVLVAAFALWMLVRRRLVSFATAIRMVLIWCAVAAALIALLGWLLPSDLVSFRLLSFGVVLFLPAGRLALAPLALGLNRHR